MGGGFIDFIAPGLGDPQAFLDPIGTPLANALGMNSPADYAFSAPWDYPSMFKEDWRAIKHLIMPDMRKDRENMTTASDTPRCLIYGRVRVSGQIVFVTTSGSSSEYLHMIVALAGHPLDPSACEEIWLDDKLSTDSSYSGLVLTEFVSGYQTGVNLSMNAANNSWDAAHIGYGIPYIYCRFTYSDGSFPAGIPTVKAVVKGKSVYDPRTGVTGYSTNPACCALDYMMMSTNYGGMGCDVSSALASAIANGTPYTTSNADDEINIESIIEAANYCDESLSYEGFPTENRYTCNGTINLDSTPAQILQQILSSMDASAVYMQGKWHVYVSKQRDANASVIDESWLNGGITFKTGANKNELVNTVKGTYINPDDYWAVTDFPIVQIADYVTEDGEELTYDKTLPFTTSPYMAQRLARMDIERSRISHTVTYPCNLKALNVAVNDVVAINNTLLGWSNKLYRVLDWSMAPTGGINLLLGLENPNMYTVDPTDLTPITIPAATNLPSPWLVTAPILDKPSEELYVSGISNTIKTRVSLTWTQNSSGISSWVVEASDDAGITWRSAGSAIDTSIILPDESEGDKKYRVKAINSLGAVSEWSTIDYVVLGKTVPPANVTNLRASATAYMGLILTWDAVPDVDLAFYAVRYSVSGTWEQSINIATAYATTVTIPSALSGTYHVKAVDTGGRVSAQSAEVITTIPSLANYNFIVTANDGSAWAGAKTGCYAVAGLLYLDMAGIFDDVSNFDALANIDSYGGALVEGYYYLNQSVNLASVQTSRCTVTVDYSALDTSALFDSIENFNGITDFGGDTVQGVMVQPQLRLSQDGSTWSDWQAFVAGDYTAQFLQFRLKLTSSLPTNIPMVSAFSISVDMPDRAERGQNVMIAAGGSVISFVKPYMAAPVVRTTIQGASSGDTEKITNITGSGFTMQVLNGGSGVSRTIDWQSIGY